MSETFDVHVMSFPAVLTGGTEVPLVHLPTSGGGITVLDAYMINAGTTVGGLLVTMTNVGTPALSGTIGALAATVTESATIPAAITISDGWVAAGEWIGFDQTSGTVPAGSFFTLSYIMGR